MTEEFDNLVDMEGKYSGERIFIVGNGPSLNKTPLESLNSEYSMAMNRISMVYPDTNWRPSFYYFAKSTDNPKSPDKYSIENYLGKNIELGIPCFINSQFKNIIGERENVFYFDRFNLWGHNPFHQSNIDTIRNMPIDQLYHFWSDNISYHIYHYHAMYGAIQTAIYLGFDSIYLVGCDLGMEYQDPHMIFENGLDPYRYSYTKQDYIREAIQMGTFFKSITNGIVMKLIENSVTSKFLEDIIYLETKDHFTRKYFDELEIIDREKLEMEVRKGHWVAKRIANERDVEIYNATLGGELDIYTRVEMNELL
jgi:hypothetical protein